MSWEYRIFYPITKGCLDIAEDRDVSEEKRSDVYLGLNADIGVKFRNHKRMEMKTRVLLSGKKEKWKKVRMSSKFEDDEAIAKEIELDDDEKKDLTDPEGKFCRVEISKRRVRFYTKDDTLCEQTDLEIKSISENFPGSKYSKKFLWRTVCVEGSKKDVLSGIKFLQNAIPSSQRMIIMGYPEFVECLVFLKDPIKSFLSS